MKSLYIRIIAFFIICSQGHTILADVGVDKIRELPKPFILCSHYDDSKKHSMEKAVASASVIAGITADAGFVKQLHAQGKVFAYLVRVNPLKKAEELFEDWREPFHNTLNGSLPEGFDAVYIGYFNKRDDKDPVAFARMKALKMLREHYPSRLLIVVSTWHFGSKGKNSPYTKQINAINKYADIWYMQHYLDERQHTGATHTESARNIESILPGILNKTVFGIGIDQFSSHLYDNTITKGYLGHLDDQFHSIVNDTGYSAQMPGIGYWDWNRGFSVTQDYICQLINHYYLEGNKTFYSDGDFNNMISNPLFEQMDGWNICRGKDGFADRVAYANEKIIDEHGYKKPVSKVKHGKYCIKTVRGKTHNSIQCDLILQANTIYNISVCALSESHPNCPVSVSVYSQDDKLITSRTTDEQSPELCHQYPSGWKKIMFNFSVKSGQEKIRVVLSDKNCVQGTTIFWDYIELEDMCRIK